MGFVNGKENEIISLEAGLQVAFFSWAIGGYGGRPAPGSGADGVKQTPERRPKQAREVCNGAAEC